MVVGPLLIFDKIRARPFGNNVLSSCKSLWTLGCGEGGEMGSVSNVLVINFMLA